MSAEETPHVFIRGEAGAVFKLDLPLSEPIQDRLLKGYLTRVADADGSPYVEGGSDIPTLPTERPAINAPKAQWVGWAVAQGMTPDDAEAATKQDLIEKYGAQATEPTEFPPPGVPEPEAIVAEPADGEVTAENAGSVVTADGVEHVGEIPAEAATA